MEPVFENQDDDRAYLARRARRKARWIQEQKRRRRRQRMLKQLLVWGAGVLVILLLVFGITKLWGKKSKENEVLPQTQADGQLEQSTTEELESINDEAEGARTDITGAQGQSGDHSSEADGTAGESGTKTEPPVYEFTEAPDVSGIYSEDVISTHAILVDESTDTIVAQKGAYERISPASMTKVLTVLVAAEQITKAQLDDTFTMTLEITDYAYVNDCSAVSFLEGETVTVRDLFYGTILPSGADAAVGLAVYVAGSHEAFADLMNEKLEELGLSDTAHFTNCVGLYDDNHYCTIYDMAVIMKAAVQNEMCREFLSAKRYTTTPTAEHPEGIQISNWFLRRIEDKDTGGEMLCAKTGYVVQSQNCAVSYGTSADGTPYICVTAGSTSSWRCIYDHVEIFNRYVRNAGE